MRMKMWTVLAAAVLLGGCAPEPDAQPAETPPPAGRAETQSIRNTDAVGYGGSAIADKVDGAVTTTEQRRDQTDRAAEEQTQ